MPPEVSKFTETETDSVKEAVLEGEACAHIVENDSCTETKSEAYAHILLKTTQGARQKVLSYDQITSVWVQSGFPA
jgi:hypothetical protein